MINYKKTAYIAPLLSILILLLAPFYGQINIRLTDIANPNLVAYKLFWDLRVPRVVVAFFAGGLLGLGGLVFQSIFKNPMGTPYTLGVASGSTLGVAFAIIFGFGSFASLFGFIGALATVITLFGVTARLKSYDSNSLLLVGIALSFFYSASLMILFYLSDESQSFEIIRFTMGTVDIFGIDETIPIVLASFGLLMVTLWYRLELRFLLTSNNNAFLKGIEVKRVNTILLLVVSVATGVCVSITGPIGFVGLVTPHIIRTLYKQSADRLIAPIFFYSGVFLVLSDFISRNLGTNTDVPIGIITSFIGGPFFVYLIVKKR
jgi:iron complex transport system permease protein